MFKSMSRLMKSKIKRTLNTKRKPKRIFLNNKMLLPKNPSKMNKIPKESLKKARRVKNLRSLLRGKKVLLKREQLKVKKLLRKRTMNH